MPRRSRRSASHTRRRPASSARRRRIGGKNRRRGAPRSAVVRRVLAVLLVACAIVIAVRDRPRAAPVAAQAAAASATSALIPVVLPISDAATVQVLEKGQRVDLYAAYGDVSPTLVASGVPLLRVDTPGDQISQNAAQPVHIVVGITPQQTKLVENLLAATTIVATVSAVHF